VEEDGEVARGLAEAMVAPTIGAATAGAAVIMISFVSSTSEVKASGSLGTRVEGVTLEDSELSWIFSIFPLEDK